MFLDALLFLAIGKGKIPKVATALLDVTHYLSLALFSPAGWSGFGWRWRNNFRRLDLFSGRLDIACPFDAFGEVVEDFSLAIAAGHD
jgi:hypothetical protein